jgi:hypothetical protein
MLKHIITIIALLAISEGSWRPVFGQLPGDFNCDGSAYSATDLVWFVNFMNNCAIDSMPDCMEENSDLDNDGISLTIADFYIFMQIFAYGPPYEPANFPFHPIYDTLKIESANALPGDHLAIPIYLKTIDTLIAFQFSLYVDSQLVTMDSLISDEEVPNIQHHCFGYIHFFSFNFSDLNDSILFLPGSYQVAELFITVNPEITDPQTAYIEFSEYPPHAYHTGLANLGFFQPMLADAEITITPMGINQDTDGILPVETSIEAYPNPFNSSVSIAVTSPIQSQLVIYDLLGRAVRSLPIDSGTTRLNWDATDNDGKSLSAGIYFAKIANSEQLTTKKLLYLK